MFSAKYNDAICVFEKGPCLVKDKISGFNDSQIMHCLCTEKSWWLKLFNALIQ